MELWEVRKTYYGGLTFEEDSKEYPETKKTFVVDDGYFIVKKSSFVEELGYYRSGDMHFTIYLFPRREDMVDFVKSANDKVLHQALEIDKRITPMAEEIIKKREDKRPRNLRGELFDF